MQPSLQKVNLRQPRHTFLHPMPALPGIHGIMQGETVLKLRALNSEGKAQLAWVMLNAF